MVKKHEKLLRKILGGRADASVDFSDLGKLLEHLGFEYRIRGSHHVYILPATKDMLNLQSDGRHAKPYQVRQVRDLIVRLGLGVEE